MSSAPGRTAFTSCFGISMARVSSIAVEKRPLVTRRKRSYQRAIRFILPAQGWRSTRVPAERRGSVWSERFARPSRFTGEVRADRPEPRGKRLRRKGERRLGPSADVGFLVHAAWRMRTSVIPRGEGRSACESDRTRISGRG